MVGFPFASAFRRLREARGRSARTDAFIASLDVARIAHQGSDFFHPAHALGRLGKPIGSIDFARDYDFAAVARLQDELDDVDRSAALAAIFDRATIGAGSDHERHLMLLEFLQRAIFHSVLRPCHKDGSPVRDPLLLLLLGEGQCGDVACLAADFWAAGGYDCRLALLGGHVVNEVHYAGAWHYFDADVFGGGATVISEGGVPSIVELAGMQDALDALPHFLLCYISDFDLMPRPHRRSSNLYPSSFYFNRSLYAAERIIYHYKSAGRPSQGDPAYGWGETRSEMETADVLHDGALRSMPGGVTLQGVTLETGGASIRWSPPDGEVVGYMVFAGSTSRSWQYETAKGHPAAVAHCAPLGWRTDMYDAVFKAPPADIRRLRTSAAACEVPLSGETFVTIMPLDPHGERIGRMLFPASEELRLRPS